MSAEDTKSVQESPVYQKLVVKRPSVEEITKELDEVSADVMETLDKEKEQGQSSGQKKPQE